MSLPAPFTVQVLHVCDWFPARGLPISAQLQLAVQSGGGAGIVVLTLTVSKVTVLKSSLIMRGDGQTCQDRTAHIQRDTRPGDHIQLSPSVEM